MPRTMLITGAGSGIGEGLAVRAAAEDWRVLVTDRDGAAAERVAQAIRDAGGDAQEAELDVTNDTDISKLFARSGVQADVLINNAGLQRVARLDDFPQEEWDRLLDVMLNGACRMTRAALAGMRDREFGRIINIGSIHSLVASPYKSAYVAAKHGLLGFAKVVALETASSDITINTICPSYVRTPLVEKQIASQAAEHGISQDDVVDQIMLKPMPKHAFISLDELYGVAKFLISDAARNITGQAITVDGGWTVQ